MCRNNERSLESPFPLRERYPISEYSWCASTLDIRGKSKVFILVALLSIPVKMLVNRSIASSASLSTPRAVKRTTRGVMSVVAKAENKSVSNTRR